MLRRALVLGGGGPAVEGWETGVIAGLAEAGISVRDADLFVGTSAGAAVALQITSSLALTDLVQHQLMLAARMSAAPGDFTALVNEVAWAKAATNAPAKVLRRVGALAHRGSSGTAEAHRAATVGRVPVDTWPNVRVLAAAVDAETGERVAFGRDSGIDVIDAVMASTAVPGIWPPVPYGGRSYMDGATYALSNADLAYGYDRVLILELPPQALPIAAVSFEKGLDILENGGTLVERIVPDRHTEDAIAAGGGNLLDPAMRERTLSTGMAQGRAVVERVVPLWAISAPV